MNRRSLALPAAVGAAVLLGVALALPWLVFVFTNAIAKGLSVLGILLLLRAGQVSFGHAMYIAIGAYTVAFARPVISEVLLLLPLAMLAATLVGIAVGAFVTRYRDIFFGMLNLAFSMVFYSLLEKLYDLTKGTDGIRVPRPTILGMNLEIATYEWTMLLGVVALAFALGALAQRFLASPLGQALPAIKTRETRLEFAGISGKRVLMVSYVISAALGGLGGGIVACTSLHVTPLLAFWTHSGELVFIAILGGAGSVLGPFLGAAVFELVRVYASAWFPDAWQMILGIVLLLIILFASRGLWGIYEDATRRARRA